jgi:hypothetical protein
VFFLKNLERLRDWKGLETLFLKFKHYDLAIYVVSYLEILGAYNDTT